MKPSPALVGGMRLRNWESSLRHSFQRQPAPVHCSPVIRVIHLPRTCLNPPGQGDTLRILFVSRPQFRENWGATGQPVIESDNGVGLLWVRE
jgi:hypothetical protein